MTDKVNFDHRSMPPKRWTAEELIARAGIRFTRNYSYQYKDSDGLGVMLGDHDLKYNTHNKDGFLSACACVLERCLEAAIDAEIRMAVYDSLVDKEQLRARLSILGTWPVNQCILDYISELEAHVLFLSKENAEANIRQEGYDLGYKDGRRDAQSLRNQPGE